MTDVVTVDIEGGNKAHFKRDPRHGLWTVNFDKGGIPALLSGEWQSYKELYDKTQYYLATREKSKTKFKEKTEE